MVEPNLLAREYLKRHFCFPVVGETYEELADRDDLTDRFDFVIISNSLENTNDPRSNLRSVRRMLKKDGLLIFEGMNLYYFNLINPYHPYIFAPEVFDVLFGLAGLKVLRTEGQQHPSVSEDVSIEHARYWRVVCQPGDVEDKRDKTVDAMSMIHAQKLGARMLWQAEQSIRREVEERAKEGDKTVQKNWDRDWDRWWLTSVYEPSDKVDPA